jgi:3-hydroxyisobutyrate dehydrogenase-like beta-hydroxyacid dehydrogenase
MTEFANEPATARSRPPLALELSKRAGCDVASMHTGIRLALETAHAVGLELPVAAAVDRALGLVGESGHPLREIAGNYQRAARA